MSRKLTRREFLRGTALTGASLIVAACTPSPTLTVGTPTPSAGVAPTTVPTPTIAATAAPKPTAVPKPKTKIRWWARASTKENPTSKLFARFNKEQDEIEVQYENYLDNYNDVLNLALQSGNPPDVFEVMGTPQQYISAGHLAPLDSFLTTEIRNMFLPSALDWDDGRLNNKTYLIPERLARYLILYEKDLLAKAGLKAEDVFGSLESLREACKELTKAGKGQFFGWGYGLKSTSWVTRNVDSVAILHGACGPYGFDYQTGKFAMEKLAPYLQFFIDLYKDGSIFPGAATIDVEVNRANFVSSRFGMFIDGSWMTQVYNVELEAGKKVNWDFALVPVFKGKRRAKEYGVLDVTVGLSSKSANLEAAWKARKYHYDNYDFLMAEGGPQPRSIKKANDPKYWTEAQKTYKGVYAVMKDIEQVVPFRVMPHTRLQVEGDNRDKVFINIILEQADMDKALPDLTKRYNAALDKAVSDGKFKPDELKPANYDYFTRTT